MVCLCVVLACSGVVPMLVPRFPSCCSHLAVFVILSDGRARLDFIQNMEYKFVELLSATFVRSSDEVVRQHITYRYNALKVCAVCVRACVVWCGVVW